MTEDLTREPTLDEMDKAFAVLVHLCEEAGVFDLVPWDVLTAAFVERLASENGGNAMLGFRAAESVRNLRLKLASCSGGLYEEDTEFWNDALDGLL